MSTFVVPYDIVWHAKNIVIVYTEYGNHSYHQYYTRLSVPILLLPPGGSASTGRQRCASPISLTIMCKHDVINITGSIKHIAISMKDNRPTAMGNMRKLILKTVTNFLVIGQGVWVLSGIKNCRPPLTKPVAVNTVLALPRSL